MGNELQELEASAITRSSQDVAQATEAINNLNSQNGSRRRFLSPVVEKVRPGTVLAIVPDLGPEEAAENALGEPQPQADDPDRFAVATEAPLLLLKPYWLVLASLLTRIDRVFPQGLGYFPLRRANLNSILRKL